MKLRFAASATALLICASASIKAQVPIIVGAPATSVLRAGTPIPIRMLRELTTEGKHLHPGDRFDIEVSEPVMLGSNIVIPAGSHGVGEVTSVRNKGMWGKSGNIEARLLYVRVGDRQVRLTGNFNDKGVTGTAGVVTSIALVPVAGFFVTGTSARIPMGSQVTAYLDEDIPVVLPPGSTSEAQPLQAVAPAAATQTVLAGAPEPAVAVTPVQSARAPEPSK